MPLQIWVGLRGIELDESSAVKVVQCHVEGVENIGALDNDKNDIRTVGDKVSTHEFEDLIHPITWKPRIHDLDGSPSSTQYLLDNCRIRFLHLHTVTERERIAN